MNGPDLSALENDPETASYRHTLRRIWESLRQRYQSAKRAAQARGVGDGAAIEAAAALRGDLRAFLSDLLTRAPASAIVDFLAAAPALGKAGELLLESQGAAVVRLIEDVYPVATLRSVAPLEREEAAGEDAWSAWVSAWSSELMDLDPRAKGLFAEKPESPQSRRNWGLWVAGGVVVVAGVAAAVAARSRRQAPRRGSEDVDPQRLVASVEALARRRRGRAEMSNEGGEGVEVVSHEDL